jgi:polyisoprenoid-binding protein YceI
MKKIKLLVIIFSVAATAGYGQKFITKNGYIKFYSETPMEKIEAHNRQINSALDIATGDFVFKVLIKSFEFEKALMQEHFNENYMESDKFPDATFTGKITNLSSINFLKDGKYDAEIEGDLKIHGEIKKVKEKGTFDVSEGKISGKSVFMVHLADYKIKIPNTVVNNISEDVQVTVDVNLEELKK